MFIATGVVSALLAALLVVSAVGKLRRDPSQMEVMRKVGYPENRLWLLAAAETAGAAGLVVGLFWWPLGAAAAAGVVVYFIGALTAHARAGDRAVAAPVVIMLAAAAALCLRVLSS